ncbi:MAG TPA: alcohol dehydrogenase catalytic domain-containing protein [Acidimicrobiales bacterium]|nr:alcohol dehydrogenase catalytic domain-containing protein [Acidimicrobiales bacterium]
MRAVRSTSDGVAVVDVPPPEGDGVTVRVRSSGICGSDLHMLSLGLPVTLGHEFAGVLADGTAVAVQPTVPCGQCDCCAAGQDQLCRTVLQRMHGVSVDGGLADEVMVHPSSLVPLPSRLALPDAALVEPLAVAVHGLRQAALVAGQRLLVIGAGTIGQLVVAVARHHRLDVSIVARHPAQVRAAEKLGARVHGLDEAEYDVVVDAAGTQGSLDLAIERVRPGGTVVIVATYWSPVGIGHALLGREVRLVPAFTYGRNDGHREFEEAAAILADNPQIVDAVVTHRVGLDEAALAFQLAADRRSGAIKVLIEP